ncbi:MAG: helix-turn-helix domain-containing protein [Rhizobiaceae bacterium]
MAKEAQSSRDIILKAAIEEFAEFGLSGDLIDRIAKRTKLNKQEIYYYFESKEALFAAAFDYGYTQFKIEPPDWDKSPSPVDALRDFVHAASYAVQTHKAHAALIIEENRSGGRHIDSSFRHTIRSTSS